MSPFSIGVAVLMAGGLVRSLCTRQWGYAVWDAAFTAWMLAILWKQHRGETP